MYMQSAILVLFLEVRNIYIESKKLFLVVTLTHGDISILLVPIYEAKLTISNDLFVSQT